jgi:uncharacterized protein
MPVTAAHLRPHARVRVDATELPTSLVERLLEVEVHLALDWPSAFTLRFDELLLAADGVRPPAEPPDASVPSLALGAEVEVALGNDHDVAVVLVGDITGIEVDFSVAAGTEVALRGYDRRHRLDRDVRSRAFTDTSDADIARSVLDEHGLAGTVAHGGSVHDYVLQHDETDLAFLLRRTQAIGHELRVDGRQVSWGPRRLDAEPAVTLTPTDLLDFAVRLSTAGQVGAVTIRGWDAEAKAPIVATARSGELPRMGARDGAAVATRAFGAAEVRAAAAVNTAGAAHDLARARLEGIALGFVAAEGSCTGDVRLRPGDTVRVEGLGPQLSGPYVLGDVAHRLTADRGFTTSFTAARSAT